MKTREPDEVPEPRHEDSEITELEEAIKDFMHAHSTKDYSRMAEIVRMAHDILHDYMDQGNRREDYDSQNEKAAEGND